MNMKWIYIPWTGSCAGTLMVLMMTDWLLIWAGLVVNLVSTLTLMIGYKFYETIESSVKYFIIQCIASLAFLMMTFLDPYLNYKFSPMILIAAIIFKLGGAPCHSWVPPVFIPMQWHIFLLLSTWQKIAPLALLIATLQASSLTSAIPLATLSMVIGAIGAWSSHSMKAFLSYSSIAQTGWFLTLAILSTPLLVIFFFIYTLQMLTLTWALTYAKLMDPKLPSPTKLHPLQAFTITLTLLSMSGVPPLMIFSLKVMTLMSLISFTPSLPVTALIFFPTMIMSVIYISIAVSTITPFISNSKIIPQPSFLLALLTLPTMLLISSLLILLTM